MQGEAITIRLMGKSIPEIEEAVEAINATASLPGSRMSVKWTSRPSAGKLGDAIAYGVVLVL